MMAMKKLLETMRQKLKVKDAEILKLKQAQVVSGPGGDALLQAEITRLKAELKT